MLKTHTVQTARLTDKEINFIKVLITGLSYRNKSNPIIGKEICFKVNRNYAEYGLVKPLTEPRLRKMINHIRKTNLHPVIATSEGYYTAGSIEEFDEQIESLTNRENAIRAARIGLTKMKNQLFPQFKNELFSV